MNPVLPAAGATYIAVIIWLVVRFVNRREWWAKTIIQVLVAFPPLYVLSYILIFPIIADGSPRTGGFSDFVKMGIVCFFVPLMEILDSCPAEVRDAVKWLSRFLH